MSAARWQVGFFAWARRQGYRARTLKNFVTHARVFEEFLEERGVDHPCDGTRELIADFQAYLMTFVCRRHRPYSTSARGQILSWLKKLYGFFIDDGRILTDPTRGLRLPRVGRRLPRSVLTAAEMRRLLVAPDTTTPAGLRDRAILELLYGTGLRFSELADLTVGDLDLVEKILWVRHGKGDKDRVLPLGRWAAYWLARHLDVSAVERRRRRSERVFLAPRAERLSSEIVCLWLQAHAAQAGLTKPITTHTLRHTFATVLVKGGADIRKVQKLLGHNQLTSTQIYTHLDLTDLRRVQQQCHPREKRRGAVRRG